MLLDLLHAHGAKATFFLTGTRVEAFPDLARRVVEAGHAVYAHGWSHLRYDQQPRHRLVEDLLRTEAYLRQFRPTPRPYLVRLPYAAGLAERWVHEAIREWDPSAQFAHWAFSLEDWALGTGCESSEELMARCEEAVQFAVKRRRLKGAVILLHEDPFDTVGAFNALVGPMVTSILLRELTDRGFRGQSVAAMPRFPRWRAFVRG